MHAVRRFPRARAAALFSFLLMAQWAGAQSSPYWITDGDNAKIYKVQNGAVQQVITTPDTDHSYPIAFGDTIRTLNYLQGYRQGREYLPTGAPTGATYSIPEGGPNFLVDGTTDGVNHNFAISYLDGGVWRFNRHWQDPQLLFTAGASFGGVAYDTATGTIWVSSRYTTDDDPSTVLKNYTTSGVLLSSTNLHAINNWGLAYEKSTDTLWMLGPSVLDTSNKQTIKNYTKTGTLLSSIELTTITGGNALGGEMEIPEPTSLATIAAAALLLRRSPRPRGRGRGIKCNR